MSHNYSFSKYDDFNPGTLGFAVLAVIFLGAFLGYLGVSRKLKKNNFLYSNKNKSLRLNQGAKMAAVGIFLCIIIVLLKSLFGFLWLYALVQIPFLLIADGVLTAYPEILFSTELTYSFAESDILKQVSASKFSELEASLLNPEEVTIGLSNMDGTPITLPTKKRVEHIAITGATGKGKTSIGVAIVRHDLMCGRGIIFIDPKSNAEDVKLMKKCAELAGRSEDFVGVSQGLKGESYFYNPIRLGNPQEKAEKLRIALDLNHPYYGPMAQSALQTIFEVAKVLNKSLTIFELEQVLNSKQEMAKLYDGVQALGETSHLKNLRNKMADLMKAKRDDLSGLRQKIGALNGESYFDFINPGKYPELNLEKAILKKKFVYLDVNPSESPEEMGKLTKCFVQDLKMLSGKYQKFPRPGKDFTSIYIDEFNTFADPKFDDFLTTARSARFALCLMFQSVGGLDKIGAHLKTQIATNMAIFIHFSAHADDDVNYNINMAGTMGKLEGTVQIDNNALFKETGKGSAGLARRIRMNPDVLKSLPVDRFFVHLKHKIGHEKVELGTAWSAKKFKDFAKPKTEIEAINPERKIDEPLNFTTEQFELLNTHPRLRYQYLSYKKLEEARELKIEEKSWRKTSRTWNLWQGL